MKASFETCCSRRARTRSEGGGEGVVGAGERGEHVSVARGDCMLVARLKVCYIAERGPGAAAPPPSG